MDAPEVMHLALCHFPAIGLLVAVFILLVGLLARSRRIHRTGLVVAFCMCLLVPFIMKSGFESMQNFRDGENPPALDEIGTRWMEVHKERADAGAPVMYVLAAVSATALFLSFKNSPVAVPVVILAAILCFTAMILAWRISSSGENIRHPEVRKSPLPALRPE